MIAPLLTLAMTGLIVSVAAQPATQSSIPLLSSTLATSVIPATASPSPFLSDGQASTAFRLVTGTLAAASSTKSNILLQPSSIDLAPVTISTDTEGHTDLDTDVGASDHDRDTHSGGVVHYYLIFISIFICLIVLSFWLLKRRRRRAKARFLPTTRDALAHEISRAWGGNGNGRPPPRGRSNSSRRRWMQRGAPWHNRAMSETLPPLAEREEGLNELGEAPPAYIKETGRCTAPSISIASVRSISPSEYSRPVQPTDMIHGPTPTIPLRALSRSGRDRPTTSIAHMSDKPPDYETATSAVNTPVPISQPTFAPR